jgi:predicted RNA binding protein YcfA (HicA-like mRNA interferase family)
MKYRELAHKLAKLGCRELPRKGRGSHRKGQNPATGLATVIPDWGSKDLKTGTIHAAVKQLGIDWRDFDKA